MRYYVSTRKDVSDYWRILALAGDCLVREFSRTHEQRAFAHLSHGDLQSLIIQPKIRNRLLQLIRYLIKLNTTIYQLI
jgi:hypothetical protein